MRRGKTETLKNKSRVSSQPTRDNYLEFMGLGRVELPTSRLSGVRSNHLSYRPLCHTPSACDAELCKLAGPAKVVNRRQREQERFLSPCWVQAFSRPAS